MSSYQFLDGVLVVEAATLGPGALGGFLADMGATVVKIEEPGKGDQVRFAGTHAVGKPNGFGFLFLRWNRGKQSVAINLRSPEGADIFKRLATAADVVIEGMRAGFLDRLGLGYEELKQLNPKLVYCSLSGLGLSGPYATRGSHGPSFDAFGGLAQTSKQSDVSKYQNEVPPAPVGMYAMGLHAALGVLSAVIRAARTGEGAMIEVAAAESSAHWIPDALDPLLNQSLVHLRPGTTDNRGRLIGWPRMDNYRTRDQQVILLQVITEKFWDRFWRLLDRPDLPAVYTNAASPEEADEEISRRLTEIILTRTAKEWMDLLDQHDIPVIKVNTFEDLVVDPHFQARNNVYDVELPGEGTLHLTSTPVKVRGQNFSPSLAPRLGEHTDAVLANILKIMPDEIAQLRVHGAVG
jgi:crotonobetainyl-CoA:carnitine CoA-transferase CaiB-like acyl-CoA transferase